MEWALQGSPTNRRSTGTSQGLTPGWLEGRTLSHRRGASLGQSTLSQPPTPGLQEVMEGPAQSSRAVSPGKLCLQEARGLQPSLWYLRPLKPKGWHMQDHAQGLEKET